MPQERFFIDELFSLGQSLELGETESHHLVRVMRIRVGGVIEIINGKNQLAQGKVATISKDRVTVHLLAIADAQTPPLQLILAQAIPLKPRLEYILEKGTELGVSSFWLFPGILSEKTDVSPSQRMRMEHILISATKQCGRLDLPTIVFKPPLLEWLPPQGICFFGDTSPEAPPPLSIQAPVTLFIGPEKGFEKREIEHLKSVIRAQGISLHTNILRVDTAAITGVGLLSYLINK